MKCPKCDYLGFETGNRCRNCGYDFSLVAMAAPSSELDLPLHSPLTSMHAAALPLFTDSPTDDIPLVHVPAVPRAPLAVRRTPDTPRAKAPAFVRRRLDETLSLEFPPAARAVAVERPADEAESHADAWPTSPAPAASRLPRPLREPLPAGLSQAASAGHDTARADTTPCGVSARVTAALVDVGILLAIDLLVVYFTLRIAALQGSEWHLLPPGPLVLFLLMLKLAYYSMFTAIGGQTIGKMAARIRVVADDGLVVEPVRAVQRTLAASASIVTLGGTFLPALLGRDRRAVHDRLAHTRVIALPSA